MLGEKREVEKYQFYAEISERVKEPQYHLVGKRDFFFFHLLHYSCFISFHYIVTHTFLK